MEKDAVILQPVVSEKSFSQSENAVYTFRVTHDANRRQVKEEVQKRFKVTVEKVNMLNRKRKLVTDWSKKLVGRRRGYRKAVVTLKSGDTIALFK